MKKSNLLELLSTFSQKEIKIFGEFISSPYYNKNENVIKLFGYLKTCYPEFTEEKVQKEKVYEHLFNKGDYNDGFMRTLIFNLTKLAEDFLIQQRSEKDSIKKQLYLLEELFLRSLFNQFEKKDKTLSTEIEKVTHKNPIYFHYKAEAEHLRNSARIKTRKILNITDTFDKRIYDETDNLTVYYMIRILIQYHIFLNENEIVKYDFNFEFFDRVLRLLETTPKYLEIPLISKLYNTVMLTKTKDDKYFNFLFELLFNNSNQFYWIDNSNTATMLENHSIKEMHKGNMAFNEKRLQLHKFIVKNEFDRIYEGSKYIDETKFNNHINHGLYMKDMEWVEELLTVRSLQINPDLQETILNYNYARYYFAQGDFDKAHDSLSKIHTINHIQYKLGIKNLYLKIYYENKWYTEGYDSCDSYRKFLSKDKILYDGLKNKYKNFITLYRELLKLTEEFSKSTHSDLEYSIINSKDLVERDWLLEKVKDLKD